MKAINIPEVICVEESEQSSIAKILSTSNNKFNLRLKDLLSNSNFDPSALDLGYPGDLLLQAGIKNLPIQISPQKLLEKKHQKNHPFKITSIIDMPQYINSPIAVFKSKNNFDCNSYVVLTEMVDSGDNIVIALTTNFVKNKISINSIRSIYPKFCKAILYWIVEDKLLLTCDKQKILNWIDNQQSHPTDLINLLEDATKVIKSF